MKTLTIILTTCLFLTSCAHRDHREMPTGPLAEHKARALSTWSGWQNKSIRDRIVPAPDVVIDYLRLDNNLNGVPQATQPAKQWQSFANEVIQAIDEFPEGVKQQLDDHAVGIFLVSDLGSSAYTETLRDATPHALGFIVLDSQALNRKANDWATWKENTPFKPSADLETRMLIEPAARDLRKNAISYIILHELGHLVGVATKAHGSWLVTYDPAGYAFSAISWRMQKGRVASKWDDQFPGRATVQFYADEKARLRGEERDAIYRSLEKTDFVSLYAATNLYDDFAETYAMYVHVVLQKRPWEMVLLREGRSVFTMSEPILDQRYAQKRAFMDSLFEERRNSPGGR